MTVTNSTAAKAPAPVSLHARRPPHTGGRCELVAVSYSRASDDPSNPTQTILAARAGQRPVVEPYPPAAGEIIARVLKAVPTRGGVARTDARFTMISKLFIGGTRHGGGRGRRARRREAVGLQHTG